MDSASTPAPVALPFAEPTPLGLLGLAIGCASLVPIAFGWLPSEPAAIARTFETTAWFCLVFGAGCQFLAGMMSLANKNLLGGTLLTTFSFNWVMNWWALSELAQGRVPDGMVVLCVDFAFLAAFLLLTYAFGFYSRLLFALLLDIDVLYILRIVRHFQPQVGALGFAIGIATIVLGLLALYIALAILLNTAAGRVIFPLGTPLFAATPPAPAASS